MLSRALFGDTSKGNKSLADTGRQAHPELMQCALLQLFPAHILLHGHPVHLLCHLLKALLPAQNL